MAALALAGQTVSYGGTVTELAVASLFKAAGSGSFSGSGDSFVLDLGSYGLGTQEFSANLGVLNAILASSYSETLGGTISGDGGGPFSVTGATFNGLTGGTSNEIFSQAGLGAGMYSTTLYLEAFSSFFGMDNLVLTRMKIDVHATLFEGAVPCPSRRRGA